MSFDLSQLNEKCWTPIKLVSGVLHMCALAH